MKLSSILIDVSLKSPAVLSLPSDMKTVGAFHIFQKERNKKKRKGSPINNKRNNIR